MPRAVFPSIDVPMAPMMNKGPELFVKGKRRNASCLVMVPVLYSSAVIFAPVGYPLTIPTMRERAPAPATPKVGFIMGDIHLEMVLIRLPAVKMPETIKKGNKEGITVL